jgi:hypothetical protein
MRKKAYPTEAKAMSVVYRIRANGTDKVEAYRCDKCGKWHVGRRG